MDRLPRRERELCKLSVIAVQLVARIFCFVSCHFFWLMAKVVGSNGPTPPTLFMGFWCAAPFPCFFVWWMKEPSTMEFLAVIGDVFSNLCCNFRGLAPKKLVLSKFRGWVITCLDVEKILCLNASTVTVRCQFCFPLSFLLNERK